MRISSAPGHPDYSDHAALGRYYVTLNGVPMPNAYFADDEAGELRAFALRDGRPVWDAEHDRPAVEVLRGKVEIIDQWAGSDA